MRLPGAAVKDGEVSFNLRMNSEPSPPIFQTTFRPGVAFGVGFLTAGFVSRDSWGMLGILFVPMIFGITAGIAVAVAWAFKFLLEIFQLDWWWNRRPLPAWTTIAIGVAGLYIGVSSARLAPDSDPEEPTYEYGPTRWPGYFLIVCGAAYFPRRPKGSARPFTAD